ncbi:MAG: YIP1 family protein [Acidobacteriota bacterium]|nr:YIP1 family protein [Acidobacteriota bacterium]
MTTDIHQTPPGAPPPPDTKKNVFERIAGVLFAPAETFQDIARKPDILAPLLIILLVGYVTTFLVMPKMDISSITAQQSEQMRKSNPNMSEEQMAQIERMTAASAKVMGWIGPLLGVVWYAILAGVLLLAFRLFGGEGTYKQAFSATLYAWIPLVLFGIILTIVVIARGTFDPTTAATLVKSNPAFLVDMKEQPILFSLLSNFDVFTIWTVFLLIVGFAALSKTSRAKAATIVLSLWAALIVVKLGLAALAASRMK